MLVVKNLPAGAGDIRHEFSRWVEKILWRRAWQPTPSHGQRSLVVYGSWGCKRVRHDWSDMAYLVKLFALCCCCFTWRLFWQLKKKLKVQEDLRVSSLTSSQPRTSSQPGPRSVNFSPSCDSSCCLSYFLRTFIVNLPINILVYLVLCFLKGVLEFFWVCVIFILFSCL